jgi:hypothetical protein
MLHSQIENEQIIERYVRNRLAPEQRLAFEEHYFGCDECFGKVKETERFVAGVRDAATRGLLESDSHVSVAVGRPWLAWAFPASAFAALVLAVLAGWAYLNRIPNLRRQLARTRAEIQVEKQPRSSPEESAVPPELAEANVPLVMLQASRASEEAATVTLRPDDNHLVLWIESGPSRYRDFRLEVFSPDNHLITTLDHLAPNRYGALAASFPTKQLPAGDFRITLTGQDPPPAALAGEYRLTIRRP